VLFSNQYIKTYNDPINQKTLIQTENSGKIGLYAWFKKLSEKFYIGNGDPLYMKIKND